MQLILLIRLLKYLTFSNIWILTVNYGEFENQQNGSLHMEFNFLKFLDSKMQCGANANASSSMQ